MAKKDKIQLHHSDDLEMVDADLAAAMEQLDQTNERVGELLQSFEPPPQSPQAADGPVEEAHGDVTLEAPG